MVIKPGIFMSSGLVAEALKDEVLMMNIIGLNGGLLSSGGKLLLTCLLKNTLNLTSVIIIDKSHFLGSH